MKHTNKRSKLLAAVGNQFLAFLILLCLSSTAAAQGTITLDFNSLPSTQGWTYHSDGAPETSIFSVSGGVLTQNTLAGPFTSETYGLFGVVSPLLPFTISIRARVLEESGSSSTNSFGFMFTGATGTEQFAIGLGTGRIQDALNNVLSTTIDNTQFHDYRLDATPGVGYLFFVDNVLVANGLPRTEGVPNSIQFGDGTRGTGAHAEITSFTFSQTLTVKIDIKPGSFPNSINPSAKGVISVAILTTADFDAATVNSATVFFGKTGTEAAALRATMEDVDGDGDIDMVLYFQTQATGIVCGTTSAVLTGKTFGGQQIRGSDSVNTVPCK